MENNIDFKRIKEQTGLDGESFFQLLLDSIPVEVFVKDTNGSYIYANETQCNNDGLKRSEILGKRDKDLFSENIYSMYVETDKKVLVEDKMISYTSGSVFTKNLRTYKAPFKKEDGSLIGVAGYSYDATETINKINELEIALNRYESVFKTSTLGIALYNTTLGNAIEINQSFSEITGRTIEELSMLPWESYSHPDEIEENHQGLSLMVQGKIDGFNMEKRFIKPDGSQVWVHMTVKQYHDKLNSSAHMVTILDITAKKEAEFKAKYYFDHDPMTGLYNRKYGDEKILELDSQEYWPLSLIVADANGLKVTNDAFGHMEGDRIIKKLANIFLELINPSHYVIRTGGDEFMAILPNTTGAQALALTKKIRDKFENDKEDGYLLSMALGCATKVSADESMDQVYQTAEARMYQSKIQDSDSHKIKIIEYLQSKLEKQNPEVKGHCINVKKYSMLLGKAVGMTEEALLELGLAAYYHDIGKVGLDWNLVNTKESLDQRDWTNVMKHPEVGYQILKSVADYGRVADYVLYHHERIDGVGYPNLSTSKEIPMQSKILALAEAYSDMTMDRPYRKELTKEQAIAEIRDGAGSQFDEKLADIFINKVLSAE